MSALDELIQTELDIEISDEFTYLVKEAAAELAELRAQLAARDAALEESEARLEMMNDVAQIFEKFHTEIMIQTARGCEGASFTEANRIYKLFYDLHPYAFLKPKAALDAEKGNGDGK